GSFEAYLAAVVFSVLGVSTFNLLLGLVFVYGGFLVGMYFLTKQLYSRNFALFTLVLLSLGSNAMFSRELVALGGYPETLLFGAVLLLIACWLIMTKAFVGRRLLAYSAWGLVAGVGLWTNLLMLPFVVVSSVLFLLFCWRELVGWAGLCVVIAFFVGISPVIIYNVSALPGQSTLDYLSYVYKGPPQIFTSFLQQVRGALLVSLPTATGAHPVCSVSDALYVNFG